jgi:hypothetical protein
MESSRHSIDDLLGEIDDLQIEMQSLQCKKNLMDAFCVSLLLLVALLWLHSGGPKRLVDTSCPLSVTDFHYSDIMIVSYIGVCL